MPNEHTIAENLQRLIDAKDDIAAAITAKGGTVAQGDGLEEFASLITSIPTGTDIDIAKCSISSSSKIDRSYILNTNKYTIAFGYWSPYSATSTDEFIYPSTFIPAFTHPLKAVSHRGNNAYMFTKNVSGNSLTVSIDTTSRQITLTSSSATTSDRIFIAVFN